MQSAPFDSADAFVERCADLAACGSLETLGAELQTNPWFENCQEALDRVLNEAIARRHVPLIKALLTLGASVASDESGSSPLFAAVRESTDVPIIELLLTSGANPNDRGLGGETPLHVAAGMNNIDAARCLLQHGADVDAVTLVDDRRTPLMRAASRGNIELLELLLAFGANPFYTNVLGETAMRVAAERAKERIREILVKSHERYKHSH